MPFPALHNFANLSGATALFLWSSTALLLSFCNNVPPFFLTAMTLWIGFCVFLIVWLIKGKNLKEYFRFPVYILLLSVFGIGGYRLLYFASTYYVPVVEASLINYLWPVLIVLFSHFLPDEKLRWCHIVGSVMGFFGIAVLLSPGIDFLSEFSFGHFLALAAAFLWAAYSVVSKATKKYSSNVVPVSCVISAFIFFIISAFTESWDIQLIALAWVPIFLLGIASSFGYFLWDIGMKQGNIKFLSLGSFFVPIVSTLLLFLFKRAEPDPHIFIATGLIFGGALVASKDQLIENFSNRR